MLDVFLKPVGRSVFEGGESKGNGLWLDAVTFFEGEPELLHENSFDLALIGVGEDRASVGNAGSALAPDIIRQQLYQLHCRDKRLNIIDMGNINPGDKVKDTYAALSHVVEELLALNVLPIILGGSHDLTYAQYLGYKRREQLVNMVVFDERIDLSEMSGEVDSSNFLLKILIEQPNFLFNFSHVGFQSYFVENKALETLERLNFDCIRLGELKHKMEDVEPLVRDADILSFDLSAIRYSDAPGFSNATPNGFTGEEACQIARYAGLSDKLSSIGFYEFNPAFDKQGITAQLAAQMVWYFADGFYSRKGDNPLQNQDDYLKYYVKLKDEAHELIFLRSKKSERWWMQLPFIKEDAGKYNRHRLIPCSYNDYQLACKDELPERWMKAYQKMI